MRLLFAVLALCLSACGAGAPAKLAPPVPAVESGRALTGFGPNEQWTPLRIAADSIALSSGDPAATRVGALVFRGGLVLDSDDPRFGGLSGLYVDGEGKMLAVTDDGAWFAARLVLDGEGALIGLVDGRMAAMRDGAGAVLDPKRLADSEDLTRLPDGRFAVSFEQTHLVRIYDLAKGGPTAPAVAEIRPGGTGDLRDNESFEALVATDEGLIVGAEDGAQGRGNPFWIVPLMGDAPAGPAGRVTVEDRFGLTGLDRLPNGDFVSLERFFAPLIGPRNVVRRLSASGLSQTPPVLDGPILAQFGPGQTIDNFEGIAVAPPRAGAPTRIYIISDDNFRKEQRTLLYAFDLVDEKS